FDTLAFDISPTAVRLAQERHPGSRVTYAVADLFAAPPEWAGAFDLVVENITVQALPADVRPRAIRAIADTVAPGGTPLLLAAARHDEQTADGPPPPLVRDEVESFAAGGVEEVRIEDLRGMPPPWGRRWRAGFPRGARGAQPGAPRPPPPARP